MTHCPAKLVPLCAALAAAAQRIYDEWDQSGEHGDPELGFGGICDDIASAMSEVLIEAGVPAVTQEAQVGDQHVFVIAQFDEGVFEVDIPPQVYETGSAYVWVKKPDVTFTSADIVSGLIFADPARFADYCGAIQLEC